MNKMNKTEIIPNISPEKKSFKSLSTKRLIAEIIKMQTDKTYIKMRFDLVS